MFKFIRQHWIAYLIGAVVAIALGLGASYLVYIKGSTPASIREEQVADEASRENTATDADGMNVLEGDAPEGTAAADGTLSGDAVTE